MSYTPITLDKVRNFRYGMKAVHLIEKTLGVNINHLDMENTTMEQAAVIIWAGLVHEDNDLTPDRVMDLIDNHSSIMEALEAMGRAFQESFGGGQSSGNVKKATTKQKNSASPKR